MENYIVSARKYRPITFDSVIGQKALVTTLKNAIKQQQLAHAYLFCGPRGVGKTTTARIFAKTINCLQPLPNHEACNKCESCVAFNEQRSFNIHELDAASNNSVDDIRSLIDQVRIPPQIGKYSVYIIDEVHMLSQNAFNAFLKTLEEPPAHAIFILATTEKHKILPTILSRCQIYDFNRIGVNDTVAHLQHIAELEGITAEAEALHVIALKSDGGMRDALSTFDQVVSFCGNNISYQHVIENLNVLDYDYYFKLVNAFLNNQVADALIIFNDILNKGFDAQNFIVGLSEHFRDILVCKDERTANLLEVGASIRDAYIQQAKLCSDSFLYRALELSNQSDIDYKMSKNKRLLIELCLIRLCQITASDKSSTKEIIQEIKPINSTTSLSVGATATQNVTTVADKTHTEPITNKQTPNQPITKTSGNSKAHIGTISITQLAKENKEVSIQNQTNAEKITRNNTFTLSQLEESWRKFAQIIPHKHKILYVFHNKKPSVNNNVIHIEVHDLLLQKDIEELKDQLLSFLKEELQNDTISLQINIVEPTKEQKAITYTEKLKIMNEKNPVLQNLYKDLGLEIL